ncbi:hypothetical protein WA026_016108 [Henosepilachna vigintioctopunctata]|uniref:Phosphatase and actin regulator n=1 Tax=Henosepilachna vigintioctopunctata TaxID=420089 RepID=A0AAW1U8X2_9CUCU
MMTKESPVSPTKMTKTKAVAIVAPQRSNSLDYLNFQEKRELIASSLSISEFLNVGNNTAKELKEATSIIIAKKQNGSAFRTNSLGSGRRTPPLERKSKFSIAKLLRPWKWKRKKKSEKLEAVSRTLERKISVRANRDELVQKGILLPESPLSPIESEPEESVPSPCYSTSSVQTTPPLPAQVSHSSNSITVPQGPPPAYSMSPLAMHHHMQMNHQLLQQQLIMNPQFAQANAANNNSIEPKKEKTDGLTQNGALSPSCEMPMHVQHSGYDEKPERPNTLGHGKLTRRLLCYHSEHFTESDRDQRSRTPPVHQNMHGDQLPPPPNSSGFILPELPEPPIPLSEIGPIPPPPMFSSPSPMPQRQVTTPPIINQHIDYDYEDDEDEDDDNDIPFNDGDSEEHVSYMFRMPRPDPTIDTSRIDEIPAKEPRFNAMPLKSALKKKPSNNSTSGTPQSTPTQENRPLPRHGAGDTSSFSSKPVKFSIGLSCTLENKENTRPLLLQKIIVTATQMTVQ